MHVRTLLVCALIYMGVLLCAFGSIHTIMNKNVRLDVRMIHMRTALVLHCIYSTTHTIFYNP